MSRYYRMKKHGSSESLRVGLVAGGVAAVFAAASFYLTRVLLSKEALEPLDSTQLIGPNEKRETGTRGDRV